MARRVGSASAWKVASNPLLYLTIRFTNIRVAVRCQAQISGRPAESNAAESARRHAHTTDSLANPDYTVRPWAREECPARNA